MSRQTKDHLRKRYKDFKPSAPSSERALDHLRSFLHANDWQSLLSFMSTHHEVPVDALHAELLQDPAFQDRSLAVPVVQKEVGKMQYVELKKNNLSNMIRNRYGIREPVPVADSDPYSPLDKGSTWMLIPCLAVNSRGFRLGHGAGYYDRFLEHYSHLIKIGLCFEAQLNADFSEDPWDARLDFTVTESRVLDWSGSHPYQTPSSEVR